MRHGNRLALLPVAVLATAIASACSNTNSAGPSPPAGATITGSLVSDRTMSGVTVNVSGTSLGASINDNRFTIRDVPSGSVRLLFRGPSLNGAIDLQSVQPSQLIELVVRVRGSGVALEGEKRRRDDDDDDDDDDDVDIEGVLTSRTGLVPNLTLVVGGRTVLTNAATTVRMDDSDTPRTLDALVVGQKLDIDAGRRSDGTIVARKIEIKNDDDDDDDVDVEGVLTSRTGLVPNLTLVVGGRTVLTNAATTVRMDDSDTPRTLDALVVGQKLDIDAGRRSDGTIVARKIEIKND